jgi:hypothetical protein
MKDILNLSDKHNGRWDLSQLLTALVSMPARKCQSLALSIQKAELAE